MAFRTKSHPIRSLTLRRRRVPFLVWFGLLFLVAHFAREAGILPDLDLLPGEPIR